MNIRILSESDVRAVVDIAAAIDIQAEAFTLLAEGRSVQGLRSFAVSETPPTVHGGWGRDQRAASGERSWPRPYIVVKVYACQ